jgi:hypothetical protein
MAGDADFSHLEFLIPTEHGPLSEWALRSQVADNSRLKYLNRARKNLERAGVPAAAIDRYLAGDLDELSHWAFDPALSVQERARLCTNFFEAVTLSEVISVELEGDEVTEANIAREKICLSEVIQKYAKIVDRWEQLERLPLDDPQLGEASRTFLYGFCRASIVLCASAVETRLKVLVGSAHEQTTAFVLIETAERAKLMGPDLASYAKDLFRLRNRAVHDKPRSIT